MMCIIIPIKYIIVNAFIELRKENPEANKLTFTQIDAYMLKIIELLDKRGKIAIVPYSGKNVSNIFREYSTLFELCYDKDGLPYIYLKDNKNSFINETLMEFNGYLPLEVLAVISDRSSSESLRMTKD